MYNLNLLTMSQSGKENRSSVTFVYEISVQNLSLGSVKQRSRRGRCTPTAGTLAIDKVGARQAGTVTAAAADEGQVNA